MGSRSSSSSSGSKKKCTETLTSQNSRAFTRGFTKGYRFTSAYNVMKKQQKRRDDYVKKQIEKCKKGQKYDKAYVN